MLIFVNNVDKINFGVLFIFCEIIFMIVEINFNFINKLFRDNVRIISVIVGIIFIILL